MKNYSKIEGDKNVVVQKIKKSKPTTKRKWFFNSNINYQLIGLIIGLLSLLIAIIIGWEEIKNFLYNYDK